MNPSASRSGRPASSSAPNAGGPLRISALWLPDISSAWVGWTSMRSLPVMRTSRGAPSVISRSPASVLRCAPSGSEMRTSLAPCSGIRSGALPITLMARASFHPSSAPPFGIGNHPLDAERNEVPVVTFNSRHHRFVLALALIPQKVTSGENPRQGPARQPGGKARQENECEGESHAAPRSLS